MARGIKESRWRFVFISAAVASAYHGHYLGQIVHHEEDALHPYIPDQAFDRGVPDRLSPPTPTTRSALLTISLRGSISILFKFPPQQIKQ